MDDTDGDGGDCDDDMTGPRDVVGTIDDDDDVGAMDDCVELICHNGVSGFFNKQTKNKNVFFKIEFSLETDRSLSYYGGLRTIFMRIFHVILQSNLKCVYIRIYFICNEFYAF